jgi:hypothetical protein
MVNFSSASDMEAEYDEERQLGIEITEAEPNEEISEGGIIILSGPVLKT